MVKALYQLQMLINAYKWGDYSIHRVITDLQLIKGHHCTVFFKPLVGIVHVWEIGKGLYIEYTDKMKIIYIYIYIWIVLANYR